jgi:hemin uptake protein HemP
MEEQRPKLSDVRPTFDPRSKSLPTREIDSKTLFLGEREVLILHGEEVYRLRITKNEKLILQK